jgi:heme/copper-type cytochrome/quinol oxidase subunit 4
MPTPIKLFTVISLFLLPTVMFGGFSLLRLIPRGKLTPEQHAWFRAGHAHAGVLLVLSLVVLDIASHTALGLELRWILCLALLVGALAQSGGMFLHMAPGKPGAWSVGNTVTTLGALLLAAAVVIVAAGVIQA